MGSGNYGSGIILTSTNGSIWTEVKLLPFSKSGGWLHSVTYGKGIFVAVGQSYMGNNKNIGSIFLSPDGSTWKEAKSLPSSVDILYGVTYAQGTFVAVGHDAAGSGIILTSANGSTWTVQFPNSLHFLSLSGVAYGKGIFVAAGDAIIYSKEK